MKRFIICFLVALACFSIGIESPRADDAPIEVAEVDLTPGVLHPTNDLAMMPTFTKSGPAPTLKRGDTLYALAVLKDAPQNLFAGKKSATFIQKIEVDGKVIASHKYLTPIKKIKGSQVLPVNFIPGKKDSPGEDWTVRFALALNDLPAGTHTLTLSIESPDADPPLLAKGEMTYEGGGDASAYVNRAMQIAHRSKVRADRAADAAVGKHHFKVTNNCRKARTIVIIEETHSAQRFTLKPKKSIEVKTTTNAQVFMDRHPRIKASQVAAGGLVDLCI